MEETSFEHLHGDEGTHTTPVNDPDESTWSSQEETALRRKLDWHVVPLVTLLYLLCFLDRANIGNARIEGMAIDLGLVGYKFNWALTVFYIVYLLVEVPSNAILKRVGPRFWIPFLVGGFGFISICTAFVKDFKQLCIARAFLGFFEGGTMPGIAFFLSCFYKRTELYFRMGIFISAASTAGAFGGLLATVLSRIPRWGLHSCPIHTWRNIFFFEGLVTLIVAIVSLFFMPSSPEKCKYLTKRERIIASKRLLLDHKANPEEQVKLHHVKRAFFNIQNNICAFSFLMINITVQSLSIFTPTILKDLGWTATKAQLYSAPPYVTASCVMISVSFISDKTRQRGIYLALLSTFPITGFCLLRWSDNANIKYMAVFFCLVGAFPGGPGFLSWAINNAAGPAICAVSAAYVVSVGTLGSIVATWTYLIKDAPKYPTGHLINFGAQCCVFILTTAGIVYCIWENRQRVAGKRDGRLGGLALEEQTELGYRHPNFRFMP